MGERWIKEIEARPQDNRREDCNGCIHKRCADLGYCLFPPIRPKAIVVRKNPAYTWGDEST